MNEDLTLSLTLQREFIFLKRMKAGWIYFSGFLYRNQCCLAFKGQQFMKLLLVQERGMLNLKACLPAVLTPLVLLNYLVQVSVYQGMQQGSAAIQLRKALTLLLQLRTSLSLESEEVTRMRLAVASLFFLLQINRLNIVSTQFHYIKSLSFTFTAPSSYSQWCLLSSSCFSESGSYLRSDYRRLLQRSSCCDRLSSYCRLRSGSLRKSACLMQDQILLLFLGSKFYNGSGCTQESQFFCLPEFREFLKRIILFFYQRACLPMSFDCSIYLFPNQCSSTFLAESQLDFDCFFYLTIIFSLSFQCSNFSFSNFYLLIFMAYSSQLFQRSVAISIVLNYFLPFIISWYFYWWSLIYLQSKIYF